MFIHKPKVNKYSLLQQISYAVINYGAYRVLEISK